jgi:hypothetical protein
MTEQQIIPMNRDNDEDPFVIGYMCLVDFECELGMASDGNTIYPSIEACKKYRPCTHSCGIVEVAVLFRKIVQEPDDYESE